AAGAHERGRRHQGDGRLMQDFRAVTPVIAVEPRVLAPVPAARMSDGRRLLRRVLRKRMMIAGAVVVVAWVFLAALAPAISPYDPIEQDVYHRLGAPSRAHWLGVDELGRDVLSRVLYGGRVSLPVAAAVVAVAAVFGTLFGGIAGFAGQWVDGLGMPEHRILLRHVLPNAFAPLTVMMTMDFGTAIIITAALSFLGLGAVPPTPEWGSMVAEGRELISQWWISSFPGVAIFMVAMACNFIGDGLRDIVDPRLR